ncbi:MAG: TonB-dependent receptor [Muribaculaceae bacterium]|nr:TonB-dependent receptor [Muribaculaceae bacterium]
MVASYVGFKSKTVQVASGQTELNITMNEDVNAMDELVVVGYGQQKKVNLTGSVDQIGSEAFEGRPSANMVQMLEGAIPNLNINLADGKPNRSASFNVRGTGSINGGNALVLIDGVEGDAASLNPDDIETVSVLKDAASSAIYGARAPFGVVLITTKNANKGKPKITYSSNYTWAQPLNVPDIVTDGYDWTTNFLNSWIGYHDTTPTAMNVSQQFSLAWYEEYAKRKEEGNFGVEFNPTGNYGLSKNRYVYFNDSRDVFDELYKDNVFSTTQSLSINGGDDKFDYYISGRYYHYDGLYNSPTQTDNFNNYNIRFKAGYQMTKWLKVSNNFDFMHKKYYNPTCYGGSKENVWYMLTVAGIPSMPMFNPDGSLTVDAVYSNGDLLYGKSGSTGTTERLRNTTSFTANLWKNHWTLNGDFTFRRMRWEEVERKIRTPYAQNHDANNESVIITRPDPQTKIMNVMRNQDYLAANIYTNFNYNFNKKHDVGATVGWNYEHYQQKGLSATNDDLLTQDVTNLQLAMGTDNKTISSSWAAYQFAGAFFRVNYAYDNRYLVEFNGRYDGSSRFPDDHRWAFFPSASIGWRIDQEKFWHVDPAIVSNVKARASYGKLGNALGLGNYQYKQTFTVSTSSYVIDGLKQRYVSSPAALPADLTWEQAATIDVGGDLAFLNRRLTVTGDWYKRKTTDMIVSGPTVPDVFGASSPKGNYAEMSTYGFEISLGYRDKFKLAGKDFNWSVKATISDNYSIIDKYNNATNSLNVYAVQTGDNRQESTSSNYYAGMRLGDIWGFVCNGLYQTQEECDADQLKAVAAGQAYYNPLFKSHKSNICRPGDMKIEDLNGNGYIDRGQNTVDDPGDRKIIGNENPRYMYSFSLNADWNGFWVSAMFQGVGKQDWYPGSECAWFWGQYNRPYAQMLTWQVGNMWTEDNPDAYLPRQATYNQFAYKGDKFANTRYLQNVAYLRLKNLQVGYKLPKHIVNQVKLQNVEVYLSGENLYTWSPLYKRTKNINVANLGVGDPDLSNTTVGQGDNYPTMRSYSVGLNITF